MFVLIVGQERCEPTEIDVGSGVQAVTFSTRGEHLVSGGGGGVRVWRVENRKRTATMETNGTVFCLAVSKDGRWIAAGTIVGEVVVWDMATLEQVFKHKEDNSTVNGVDFSPDSSRLVFASDNRTASIWDIATRERVQTLHHDGRVFAAKYSPQGDRIATASRDSGSVYIYDSSDGHLIVDIKVTVLPYYNAGVVWFNNHLLVLSASKIVQVEVSTGSPVGEWPVPDTKHSSCIALPKHGKFVAYSTDRTVSFWNTETHTQLGHIQHPEDIQSIAVSPDDQLIAIGGGNGKIILESLSHINVSTIHSWFTAYADNSTLTHDVRYPLPSKDKTSRCQPRLTSAIIRLTPPQ